MLMQKLTDGIVEYLHMQIDAGADALQILTHGARFAPQRTIRLGHYAGYIISLRNSKGACP